MPLFILIYTALMVRAIMHQNLLFIAILLLFGFFSIAFIHFKKVLKIKKTKELISKVINDDASSVIPFINVNRDEWYIINEVPRLSSAEAKKVVWNRRHNGIYTSFDDFIRKNPTFDNQTKDLLKKIIKFK